MKDQFTFQANMEKQASDKEIGELYFAVTKKAEEGKAFTVSIKDDKNPKQLRGYWRICGLLLPCFREKWGECFDKEMVSNIIKESSGYSMQIGKVKVVKSLKTISLQDMNILIEKLYYICEHYGIKDYELRSQEQRDMEEYFNNKKE